jgi:hypothetical protein
MIIGICMVRDEEDILDQVLRHTLAQGVDHLIVADNLSVDRTPEILNDLKDEGAPLTVLADPVLAYEQAAKMSGLARKAYEMGAEWVLPFDADEVWYGVSSDGSPCRIADALSVMDDVKIVRAPGWDHINRGDGDPFSPYRRQQMQQLAKVAFRAHPAAQLQMGNHDVTLPGPGAVGQLAFRHFQYRSLEQMTRKLRQGRQAYEASDVHPMHGTHWRQGGLKSDEELAADWNALCLEEGLVHDPAPLCEWMP